MPVYKRRKRWQVVICFKGKRYRVTSPGTTREAAQNYEARLRRELTDFGEIRSLWQKQEEDAIPTLHEFVGRWIADYVSVHNRAKEQKNKAGTMEHHILPLFGDLKMNAIGVEHVDRYKKKKLSEGLNPKTINNHLQIFHQCLATAREWKILEDVPAMKQLKAPESPWNYLSKEETGKLMAVIPEGSRRTMFLLAVRTGLRFSEFSALRWEDISFERNEITVRRSIVEGNVGSTKNNRIRRVPMTPDLRQMLEAMPRTEGYIFEMNGKPILYKTAYDWLKRYCKEAEVPSVTMHQLRHSFASQLVALGAPLLSVRQLMGHADIKMTMRYAHLGPNELQGAVDLLTRSE